MLISSARRRAFRGVELLVLAGIVAIAAGLIVPAIAKVKSAAGRIQSSNNLKMIALATIDMADSNQGHLPLPGDGAYPSEQDKADENGRRVRTGFGPPFFHVIPYVESNSYYKDSYSDEDELYLAKRLRGVSWKLYQAPYDTTCDLHSDSCSYAVNELAFTPREGQAFIRLPADFKDGVSATILYAEQYAHQYGSWGTGWPNPRIFRPYDLRDGEQVPKDPPFQRRPRVGRDAFDGERPQSFTPSGLLVVTGDAHVHHVTEKVTAKTFFDACTPDGGVELSPDW
jgi:type II secretory pathway pseudopilin PulG